MVVKGRDFDRDVSRAHYNYIYPRTDHPSCTMAPTCAGTFNASESSTSGVRHVRPGRDRRELEGSVWLSHCHATRPDDIFLHGRDHCAVHSSLAPQQ